ncbi:lysosomal cobalamin transporter ABCD4-like [Uloborus diversus]|uniref:lysosomal cobalamin transporter ABCD4-like n=1 Tax=Uloborus diversus TaxID=327109 RepID=UPI002409C4B2|nr:lysosomal cobalamin transporter ABCD4-like [Uloborus diversus]
MDEQSERMSLFEIHVTPEAKSYSFGIFTLRRLKQLFSIILSKRISVIFVLLICALALIQEYLVYNVGIIPSGFYKVLGDKNWNAFWLQVLKATLLICAICSVLSCSNYITNVFYVSSREILTNRLHSLYFSKNRFYYLNTFKRILTDNPDQRITQDIDKFCQKFSSVIKPIVIAPFTISYYSYNCFHTTGWVGPTSIFLIFIVSAAFSKLLMKPVMLKVIQQEKCEGYFRFKHMHIRSNAELIAFQEADKAELYRTDSKLIDLIITQQSRYLRNFPLDFFTNFFSYIGSIVSYLILAYPIFSGLYSGLTPAELSALISQNAFVSIYLISCFSSLINTSAAFSEIGGLTHRVCEILDVLLINNEPINKDTWRYYDSNLILRNEGDCNDSVIELKDVTFCAPKESKPLIANISLQIKLNSNLLITGKSGSGKTSLFRIVKGLWPVRSGSVIKKLPFQPSTIFFLPQRSLLSDGTLMEQIVYPLILPKHLKLSEEDLIFIRSELEFADLEHLLKKTGGLNAKVDWDWNDVLSPGEAQRLSFVRLFYHKPKLAFLDEATSALGSQVEAKLYKRCKDLGITVISIGHHTSLLKYHDNVLHLDGEGGWTLSPVSENRSDESISL